MAVGMEAMFVGGALKAEPPIGVIELDAASGSASVNGKPADLDLARYLNHWIVAELKRKNLDRTWLKSATIRIQYAQSARDSKESDWADLKAAARVVSDVGETVGTFTNHQPLVRGAKHDVQVFRPNIVAYFRRVGGVGLVILGGAVLIGLPLLMLGVHNARLSAVVATVLGLGAVFAIYIRNVRIEIDKEEVRLYGMFGGHKSYPRSAIKGFRVLEVMFRGVGRSKPIALAFGRDRHALFTLEASLWANDDLRRIGSEIGGTGLSETVANKEVIARYPGSLNFVDRHYWVVGGCLPFLAIALAFALAPFCAPGP
jgi:hypothetical protein